MRQTINGVLYDTSQATLLRERDYYSRGLYSHTRGLYQTHDGEYFFAVTSLGWDYLAPQDGIDLACPAEAKFFLNYEEMMGIDEEV